MRKPVIAVIFIAGLLAVPATVSAQQDMAGSQDHPDIPRIEGTTIVGYAHSAYDQGEFITGMKNKKLQTAVSEGERTRLVYLAPKTISPLRALRNYQTALADLGEVEEVFSCRKEQCDSRLPANFMWSDQRRVHNKLLGSEYAFLLRSYYRDQLYWYGTVTGDSARYHVSVYSSVFSETHQVGGLRGYPTIHLEILQEADFEATLEVVTADEISASISEKGHIALYGIHFDFDSASLKPESKPALESIATALKNDPSLSVYVVGHTDNQGSYEYNLDLSKRRAASVVQTLTGEHGISGERLIPLGVGPVAPVSSNATEEGMALNRRVELVKL